MGDTKSLESPVFYNYKRKTKQLCTVCGENVKRYKRSYHLIIPKKGEVDKHNLRHRLERLLGENENFFINILCVKCERQLYKIEEAERLKHKFIGCFHKTCQEVLSVKRRALEATPVNIFANKRSKLFLEENTEKQCDTHTDILLPGPILESAQEEMEFTKVSEMERHARWREFETARSKALIDIGLSNVDKWQAYMEKENMASDIEFVAFLLFIYEYNVRRVGFTRNVNIQINDGSSTMKNETPISSNWQDRTSFTSREVESSQDVNSDDQIKAAVDHLSADNSMSDADEPESSTTSDVDATDDPIHLDMECVIKSEPPDELPNSYHDNDYNTKSYEVDHGASVIDDKSFCVAPFVKEEKNAEEMPYEGGGIAEKILIPNEKDERCTEGQYVKLETDGTNCKRADGSNLDAGQNDVQRNTGTSQDSTSSKSSLSPAQCSICKKRLRDKYSLRRHMRIHEGVFKCGICSKTFGEKRKLLKHEPRCLSIYGSGRAIQDSMGAHGF